MITIFNVLSLIRAPLALLFLQTDPLLRLAAILLAALTDFIDGHLARRYGATSRLGAILDPLMDKFFVYFALALFFQEGAISLGQITAMLSRDFALCLYGLFIGLMGRWRSVVFRSFRWGKITTALQFVILSCLALGLPFPAALAYAFILMGLLVLLELFQQSPIRT